MYIDPARDAIIAGLVVVCVVLGIMVSRSTNETRFLRTAVGQSIDGWNACVSGLEPKADSLVEAMYDAILGPEPGEGR